MHKNGLISKTAATKASLIDAKSLKHGCPNGGMVVADKGYCTKPAARDDKSQKVP
ncbi:hypothetical protein [Holospora curviuscula]|uniref:hypothetical protein n=1 Tax=Holospora curviuscula TaxID=1082868 RepID=UPI0013FD8FFE|nr:hypothetical protein [Holospora curviuscula]